MRNIKEKSNAFTLVEILTVVFLGALIILAAYTAYLISYKSYHRNSQSAELTQNGRIALERMTRDLRQAVELVTVLPENPGVGAPPAEIKFQDGHDYWPTTGKIQYITYYLSGTDLYRKVSHYAFPSYPDDWVLWSTTGSEGTLPTEYTDLNQIKAQNISQLQFWGEDVIIISFDVSDGTSTYSFETKVLGRNIQ